MRHVVHSRLQAKFVGRQLELDLLRELVSNATTTGGSLALLLGEPGIGKTRLAHEIANEAQKGGFQAVWGRSPEAGSAPPFWPWIQILTAIGGAPASGAIPGASESTLGEPGRRRVISEVRSGTVAVAHERESRFMAFAETARFLESTSLKKPLILIVEDLHWFDSDSLALLAHIAGDLGRSQVVIIATARVTEGDPSKLLRSVLGDLLRHRTTWTVSLKRLSHRDVRNYLVGAIGRGVSVRTSRMLWRRSGGNPLFLTELIRQYMIGHDSFHAFRGVPESIVCLINNRLASLSESGAAVVRAAAVIGEQFDEAELARVAQLSQGQTVIALAETLETGLIVEKRHRTGRYEFSHEIVRESVYTSISGYDRRRLHCRVARMLEAAQRVAPAVPASRIAHHYTKASGLTSIARRVTWVVRAGQEAAQKLAFEDATLHYSYALQLLPPRASKQRFELLLALGGAQNGAGKWQDAKGSFHGASRLARSAGDFAQAALGFRGVLDWSGPPDPTAIELLREALDRIGTNCSRTRVLLLSALVKELYLTADPDGRKLLADEAQEVAITSGDAIALAHAVEAGIYAQWGPTALQDTIERAARMIRTAIEWSDAEREFRGRLLRYSAYLQIGDLLGARSDLEACSRLSQRIGTPRYEWHMKVVSAGVALTQGDLAAAVDAIEVAYKLGVHVHVPTAIHYRTLQMFLAFRLRGSGSDVGATIAAQAGSEPKLFLYELGSAWGECLNGKVDSGKRLLQTATAERLRQVGDDAFCLLALCGLAELCYMTNDKQAAELVYQRLMPYSDHYAVVSWAVASDGAIAHHLGLLATTLERWTAGERHFETALELNGRLGSHAFVERSQHYCAAMLLRRLRSDDYYRASELLAGAIQTYRRLGMQRYLKDAEALAIKVKSLVSGYSAYDEGMASEVKLFAQDGERNLNAHGGGGTTSVTAETLSGTPTCENVFRREGDYWTLVFQGKVTRFKDKRGLQYLAYLLANPFKQVHSLDLASSVGARQAETPRGTSAARGNVEGLRLGRLGDAGPALDARARTDCRRRVDELRQELEQAEAFNDLGRATILRQELDELTSYLAAALRPGRGARSAGSYSERARVSVRNNIASVMRAIGDHDDALGRHLSNAIRTGTFCSYTPERKIRWDF